jgi:hypothetical protein
VHGNVTHALRALGGSIASDRHGRGDAHDKARAGLAWGIGHWGQHGAGGKVTVQEVDGGVLTGLASTVVSRRCLGRCGVCWVSLCVAGPG